MWTSQWLKVAIHDTSHNNITIIPQALLCGTLRKCYSKEKIDYNCVTNFIRTYLHE